jgi:RNA polymerase sigma factor (sigma-70 family)
MGAEIVAARRRDLLPAAVLRRASDQRLVEQALAGSERAFEVLFDRHHRPVLAFCRHMLGSREEAEDAMQQTFMAAYRELGRAEQPPEMRPWLYGVARHRCLSALRARRARSLQEVPERGADRLITDVTVREDLRAALADVSRLPDDQRAALMLAALGDMSHAEIARILGCPRDKVKALVFQARSSLVTGRAARESPCAEIQEQLRTLRGGGLRRAVLRRHLHDCSGCRAYREKLRIQRRQLGLLLPVGPTVGLKRSFLGALFGGSGGGGGGAALTAGALSCAGLAATALVTVTIPAGTVSVALTGFPDGRQAARPVASTRATGPGAAPASASIRSVSAERAREGRSAGPRVKERPAQATANANDKRPAPLEQTGARDHAEWAHSRDQAELAKPQNLAKRSEPSNANRLRPVKPAKPLRPPKANGHVSPAKPPTANSHVAPARPPKANGQVTPAKPPTANSQVAPAKPANDHAAPPKADGRVQTGPDAAREPAPVPRPSAKPSPGGAKTPGASGDGGHGGAGRASASG